MHIIINIVQQIVDQILQLLNWPISTNMLKANTLQDNDQQAFALSYKRSKVILTMRAENRKQILNAKRKILRNTNDENQSKTQGQNCLKDSGNRNISLHFSKEVAIFKKQQFKIEDFPQLANKVQSQQILQKLQGAIGITKLYSQAQIPISLYFEEEGLIKQFVKLAQQTQELQLQFEAAWNLANIASGNQQKCAQLIKLNCMSVVFTIMRSQTTLIVQQGIWIIGNLSCESKYRDMLLNQGAISLLTNWLAKAKDERLTSISAWALSNLCRGNPLPQYSQVVQGVATLCRVLAQGHITDEQTFISCCWAISYHCDAQKKRQRHVLQTNLYMKMIQILNVQSNSTLVMPCMRILGNMLMGGNSIVQKMLQFNAINAIQKHLVSEKKIVRRQACWCLANITASKLEHIQQIIRNSTLMERLLEMFHNEYQENVRVEIAAIFCNMCHQQDLNIDQFIINAKLLPIFLQLLNSEDDKIIIEALNLIQSPLRLSLKKVNKDQINPFVNQMQKCQIATKIQSFQYHKNDEIYWLSRIILQGFFELEDPLSKNFNNKSNKLKEKKQQ